MSVYTGGGEEYLRVHQTNTLSTKLTAIVLGIVAVVFLYIIIRVGISLREDRRLSRKEKEENKRFIEKILGRKSKSDNNE